MLDFSIRLRRAIRANDLLLVQRICSQNSRNIRNPDYGDKGNTSLHIACELGFYKIVAYLVDLGHEDDGISKNYDSRTPLMLAAASPASAAAAASKNSQEFEEIVNLLLTRYDKCLEWRDKWGYTALVLASKSGCDQVVSILLEFGADIDAADILGNTSLHYASAYGHLRSMRSLIDRGANTEIINRQGWVAHAYSYSQPSETYFLSLIKSKGLAAGLSTTEAAAAAAAAQQTSKHYQLQLQREAREQQILENSISNSSTSSSQNQQNQQSSSNPNQQSPQQTKQTMQTSQNIQAQTQSPETKYLPPRAMTPGPGLISSVNAGSGSAGSGGFSNSLDRARPRASSGS